MKKTHIILLSTLFATTVFAQGDKIAVRGQVVVNEEKGVATSPLAHAKIELIEYFSADKVSVIDSARTDLKGFYYLNVKSPHNSKYYIRVNGNKSFPVTVKPTGKDKKYHDIPKLLY